MKDYQYYYILGMLTSIKTDTMEQSGLTMVGLALAIAFFVIGVIKALDGE